MFAHDLRHRYYQPHVLIGAEGTSAVVAILLILGACGPNAAAPAGTPPAPGASAAAAPSAPASSTNQTAGMGYLEGRASIGPLQPVERVGVPTPAPPPAACTSRGMLVYAADSGAEVLRIAFGPDCTYRVALPAGSYRVELDRRGIDSTRDLPRAVTIVDGQTTRLDVSIDTGIR